MADFVAVIKKTIDGMGETTPEMRARVYDKARATISAKLAAINPPPAPAVVERQKSLLEQAIASVEGEYSSAAPAEDDFEAIMASLSEPKAPEKTVAAPARPTPPPPAPPPPQASRPVERASQTPANDPAASEWEPANQRIADIAERRSRGRTGGLVAVALIALVFIGAAGYAVWLNRDEVAQLVGMAQPGTTEPAQPSTPSPAAPAQPETGAAQPEPATPAQPVTKFTQKLNTDGSETDTGPAGGTPGVGEGTSVAELTVPPPAGAPANGEAPAAATPPAAPAAETPVPAGGTPPAETAQAPASEQQPAGSDPAAQPAAPSTSTPAGAEQQVAVGQRAIFYEERTSAADGSAQQGNTVWSIVQESPGGDLPPEPAIRAEATIPGKDIQLRMTIRRNADTTLPASHIIEMIFLTPENFEGGVIDNLLRMTFKETEEATGNPVVGSPAKIGDGFFLIALADGSQEREANMQLFRRMKWIDIPIVYRSGRRALMTLERGIPGDRVFDEALKAWAAKSG